MLEQSYLCVFMVCRGWGGLGKCRKDVTMQKDWHLTNYLLQWRRKYSSRANICSTGLDLKVPPPPPHFPFPVSLSPAVSARQGSHSVKNVSLSISHFRLLLRATEECEVVRWQTNSGAMIAESFEIPLGWGWTCGPWHNNTPTSPHIEARVEKFSMCILILFMRLQIQIWWRKTVTL